MGDAIADNTTQATDISDDIARYAEMGLLNRLLKDRSTARNIIWASNVFVDKGDSYAPSDEILASDITGNNVGLIRTRASKAREAQAALRSTYGYEYQGNSLLMARVNVLATMEDFAAHEGYALTAWSYKQFVYAISYNLWQMDGLTDTVPKREMTTAVSDPGMDIIPGLEEFVVPIDDYLQIADDDSGANPARVYDWNHKAEIEFGALKREEAPMRFDYVIGNPPYQEETDGNGRQQPIYDRFMDASYAVKQ